MQEPSKTGDELHQIALFLYHSKNSNSRLTSVVDLSRPFASTGRFVNLREVGTRVTLTTGTYIMIPATFNPDETGNFLIRVFCKAPVNVQAI
jgi:hypothetical protein